jgi:NADPH2:quinone reductase
MESGGAVRAIVVHEQGGPEKLVLEEVPDPTPGPGEVLVDIEAAGLNFIDVYQRNGLYRLDLPFIPGQEGAGIVSAIGPGVSGIRLGDRVGWVSVLGGYAERVVLPAEKTIPIPDAIGSDVAAAVLLQGMTAHYLATDTFPLREGHKCLIHAGAGGVGLLLTQIASIKGAHIVTTVGSREKADLSREAGADQVVVYTETGLKEAIEETLGPRPLHVVFDGVGAATFDDGLDLLARRGMMVTFGNASGPVPPVAPLTLMQKGSLFLTRPTLAHYLRTREEMLSRAEDLFGWIEAGVLEVRIGAEYPLTDVAKAHEALESRQTTGKVLIRP